MTRIFQVDAFTDRLFGGNPAAVVPLQAWPDDTLLQSVAMENNLAETAFIVPVQNAYELRWFTPLVEVSLCGHATLATAHVLIKHYEYSARKIEFITRESGVLTVERTADDALSMDFPAISVEPSEDYQLVAAALGAKPAKLFRGNYSPDSFDYVAVFESQQKVKALNPLFSNFAPLDSRGVIATSRADNERYDFVSRYFAPNSGINEDPVTGSAHCLLVPYWSKELGSKELAKHTLLARQISARGGEIRCMAANDRVVLTGSCVDYLQGEIDLDSVLNL